MGMRNFQFQRYTVGLVPKGLFQDMQKAIKHSDLKIILRIFRGVSVDLQIFVSPNRFFTSVGICWNDSSPMMSHQDVIHWYHIEMTSILTLPQENARSRSNNSPEIWISNSAKKLQPSHWTSPWRHPLSLAPNLLHPSTLLGHQSRVETAGRGEAAMQAVAKDSKVKKLEAPIVKLGSSNQSSF